MGILKRCIIGLLLVCLMLSALTIICYARTEARYELRSDGVVFGNDLYSSSNIQTLFHQQSQDTSDAENYRASFPGALDLNAQGSPGDGVDIALPSIHEDTSSAVLADNVGFFRANYNYRPEANYGNMPLSMDYPARVSQAISPAEQIISPLYPEQYGAIAIRNKLKKFWQAQPATVNKTEPGKAENLGIPLNREISKATSLMSPDDKKSFLLNITGPKNASSKPEIPLLYPSDFDMAGRDGPVFPNPGIGSFSTNGAGSTGASLTGPVTKLDLKGAGNQTSNRTSGQAQGLAVTPTGSYPDEFTYANFNFDATTEQINNMTLLERMWRNAHRGGTMGKAYAGDTSYPLWIDPYERPYDLPRIDEHWYVLQSALNMCVPGTQIMPRYWSLMF